MGVCRGRGARGKERHHFVSPACYLLRRILQIPVYTKKSRRLGDGCGGACCAEGSGGRLGPLLVEGALFSPPCAFIAGNDADSQAPAHCEDLKGGEE